MRRVFCFSVDRRHRSRALRGTGPQRAPETAININLLYTLQERDNNIGLVYSSSQRDVDAALNGELF